MSMNKLSLKSTFIAILSLCLYMLSTFIYAQNVKTYIPPNAIKLAPIYGSELSRIFPDIPTPWYTLALTEHESCISLKHSRCFSHTSTFMTKWPETGKQREVGAGLSMISRAWKPDGTIRMDTLAGLKRAYPQELKDLTWDNISSSPELQIRAMVLLLKEDYTGLRDVKDPINRLYMADSAYNGGRRDVLKSRKICGMTKGCDPDVWFDNVELHCVKSKKALYAGRSACDINTHHVYDVVKTRMPKYQKILPTITPIVK